MQNMFVYVFNTKARDSLLKAGYQLLKADLKNDIYIFENKEIVTFDFSEIDFALSSILTF